MNDDREKRIDTKYQTPVIEILPKLLWKKKVFPIKSIRYAFFG